MWSVDSSYGVNLHPAYIISLHGVAIKDKTREDFWGYTFGVKSFRRLGYELAHKASKQVNVTGLELGQVSYQYSAYRIQTGSLSLINSSPFRKDPIEPFISQDEWRIVIHVKNYIDNNPNVPLKLEVDPNHFFRYIF